MTSIWDECPDEYKNKTYFAIHPRYGTRGQVLVPWVEGHENWAKWFYWFEEENILDFKKDD